MECNLHKKNDPIVGTRYTKPGLLPTLTVPSYKASFSQVGIQLLLGQGDHSKTLVLMHCANDLLAYQNTGLTKSLG